ncbi:hypothetical protein GGS24DRAFT_503922 [Hypoxylon argillaceum]|nr:hypothetical protein GGS24DRAFT_503922 [Hypoxylon argillaceum]
MAAMGIVDDNVEENSGLSPDLAAGGSWYGTTVGTGRSALASSFSGSGYEGSRFRLPRCSARNAARCAVMRHGQRGGLAWLSFLLRSGRRMSFFDAMVSGFAAAAAAVIDFQFLLRVPGDLKGEDCDFGVNLRSAGG